MDCLGCNAIQTVPVTLIDGRTVCNSCPEWRHDCEVREVASWETNEQRRNFLDGVEQYRGKPAADRLRADVWAFISKP